MSAASAGTASGAEQPLHRREDAALPAWPLLIFLWGYPVFWVFGLLIFGLMMVAVPMVAFLMLRHRVLLVPGIVPWAIFAVWIVPCMTMIDTPGRMVATGVQLGQYVAVVIAMIYIVNARETLTPTRVFNGIVWIWFFVIIGGYLGMLFPEVRLTLTVGHLLPSVITANDYVQELVYPNLAEIQTPFGADEPFVRPSAPFAYTNTWGSALAVLTPIVIGSVIGHHSVRAYLMLAIGIIAIIPPAVASTNRGLLVGLGVCVAYLLIRLVLRRKWLMAFSVTAASLITVAALAWAGFFAALSERQQTVDTTAGRADLYVETFERTLGSPILGYGSSRPSIDYAINIGTHGAVWNAMFSFGFVGLALFLVALLAGVFRTIDAPNPSVLWVHSSMVVALGVSFFYGLDRQLVFVLLAVAVLLREKYRGASDYWTPEPQPLGRPRVAR